jgi:O-glycosyl hydrolase
MKLKQKSIAVAAGLALVLLAFISAGCRLEVLEVPKPVLLVEPYITTQPASISYKTNAVPSTPPTLEVAVEDWTPADGTLTFQWYSFASYFNYLSGVVVKEDEDVPAVGADPHQSSFTPMSFASTTAGERYYYYVEVTNTNPVATNKPSSTIKSEVAIISFLDPAAPSVPIITHQPAGTSARFGRPVPPLSVRVKIEDMQADSEITYQWYGIDLDDDGNYKDDDDDGIPDATELLGEIYPSFTPPASQLGDSFFYVKVTHTVGRTADVWGPDPDDPDGPEIITIPGSPGVSSSEISIPATVFIDKGLRAGAPVISVPPQAALYIGSEAVVPLTVEAESPDFGDLSFQWYSNTRPGISGDGVALVETQTSAETTDLGESKWRSTYTPTVTGNNFYFVVVTNYNSNVVGAVTATATTHAVNVRRQTTAAPASGNAQVTINNPNLPSSRFNYVRGYGGMEVAWANFPETFPEDTELQYDPDKLGYNILRIMLPVSNTNIDLAMDDLVNVTKRRPHYYDNVKIVNKYGGYVAAAPWSPPKEWKSNNSINGGGILRHEYYKQYATYLKSFAQHMNNRGAPIYCISIQNEPNYTAGYDGCEWTPDEMRDFFITAGRFTEGVKGWGGGKQIPRVLTMNGESANNPHINDAAINNPVAFANIDLFGRHVYGDRRQNLWARLQGTKEVWMTEHNINSANAAGYYNDSKWDYIWKFLNDVDLVMRLNNENAFVWWAGKRFYSMVGDGQYGTPPGQALPRGWALSHYSKYTIDMTRIGISMTGVTADGAGVGSAVNTDIGDMDNISARITAYISQDGNEISMLLWTPTLTSGADGHNMGTIEITMPGGFTIGSATGIQSYKVSDTENRYQEAYEPLVSQSREKAYITLPRSRIISVKFTKQIIDFTGVTASGSPTTTQLNLTFSAPIPGLSADDIALSGVSGTVTKGTLTGTGPTYTLPISGSFTGGTLNVAVTKAGYVVSGSPKTVTIYHQ